MLRLVPISLLGLACIATACRGKSTPPSVAPWPEDFGPGTRLVLREGWVLQSSASIDATPAEISDSAFAIDDWYSARVPSTVVGTLVENGVYEDPLVGMHIRELPGMDYDIGESFANIEMQPESPFAVSWWYRTEFTLPAALEGRTIGLTLDGINYSANVWVNGEQVAAADEVQGTYRSFELDITGAAHPGSTNALAVELFAPVVDDLAHNWVDWNPSPPDKNLGLWRDVWVSASGAVTIREPQVVTDLDLPSLDTARLAVSAKLTNGSGRTVTGTLRGTITGTRNEIAFERVVTLDAGETTTVTFAAPDDPRLDIADPDLWWPFQYGDQPLQTLALELASGDDDEDVSDRSTTRFGLREMTSELTPEGGRLFAVNGQPILVRGAGWARDIFFMESEEREAREVALVRDMGLNTVRFEGKFGSEHLMDLLDEEGILVIAGWCCCDSWARTGAWGDEQYRVAEASMRDMALRLRNRASVLTWWYGSDNPPVTEAQEMYLRVLDETSWPNPAQSGASETPTDLDAPTGIKMRGPYKWEPPNYWLEDETRGGAWGFASEISPGAAVPEVESLQKMLGEDHLWPIDDVWRLHTAGGAFLDVLDISTVALEARYGSATDLDDYARKSQALAYEAERAMFEGYGARKYAATGVIQWMLNNAWPAVSWHLYDYYLAAGGGYYGTKKALEPVHIQYNAGEDSVAVVNSSLEDQTDLVASIAVLSFDLTVKYFDEAAVDSPADSVVSVVELPTFEDLTTTYFLSLELRDASNLIVSRNFYWLSTAADALDWDHADWFSTPLSSYADLTLLETLPTIGLTVDATREDDGDETTIHVTVANPAASLALLVRLFALDAAEGKEILPTRWEDNYFTLLPGEVREIDGRYVTADAQGAEPSVAVDGWNVNADTHDAVAQ